MRYSQNLEHLCLRPIALIL